MKDKERFWVRGPGEGGGRIEGVGIGRVRCKKGRVSEKARERERERVTTNQHNKKAWGEKNLISSKKFCCNGRNKYGNL